MEVKRFTSVELEVGLEPLGIVCTQGDVVNLLVGSTVLLQLLHQPAVAIFVEERRPRVCRTHHAGTHHAA